MKTTPRIPMIDKLLMDTPARPERAASGWLNRRGPQGGGRHSRGRTAPGTVSQSAGQLATAARNAAAVEA